MFRTGGPGVVDVVTAEDPGAHCDHCSDPIDRGDLVAVLSNGDRVHDDGCRPGIDIDTEPEHQVSTGEPDQARQQSPKLHVT